MWSQVGKVREKLILEFWKEAVQFSIFTNELDNGWLSKWQSFSGHSKLFWIVSCLQRICKRVSSRKRVSQINLIIKILQNKWWVWGEIPTNNLYLMRTTDNGKETAARRKERLESLWLVLWNLIVQKGDHEEKKDIRNC